MASIFPFVEIFLPSQDLHCDFVSQQPHTKWQRKMVNHVKISQFFFLNLIGMPFLADPDTAELKLIKF